MGSVIENIMTAVALLSFSNCALVITTHWRLWEYVAAITSVLSKVAGDVPSHKAIETLKSVSVGTAGVGMRYAPLLSVLMAYKPVIGYAGLSPYAVNGTTAKPVTPSLSAASAAAARKFCADVSDDWNNSEDQSIAADICVAAMPAANVDLQASCFSVLGSVGMTYARMKRVL